MDQADQVLRLFLFDPKPAGLDRLCAALPDHIRTPLGLEIPLNGHAPEEILALCLRFGVTARATRIVTRASGRGGGAGLPGRRE